MLKLVWWDGRIVEELLVECGKSLMVYVVLVVVFFLEYSPELLGFIF
jgi:hypothetical protein